jgi:hypothetical protein
MLRYGSVLALACFWGGVANFQIFAGERELALAELSGEAKSLDAKVDASGTFTWWMPEGADAYVLPVAAGIHFDAGRTDIMDWLRGRESWPLTEIPVLGVRYGTRMLVAIVPWPQYAELVVSDRVGVRYAFPEERHDASPAGIVAMLRGDDPMEVARAFREWRGDAEDIGIIPRSRTLTEKIGDMEEVERLLGAPNIYLWGHALFSRFDVPNGKWIRFAKALEASDGGSLGAEVLKRFDQEQQEALGELAKSDWPAEYLTRPVAAGIATGLADVSLQAGDDGRSRSEAMYSNVQAFAELYGPLVNPVGTWGDGLSESFLNTLHESGIDRALLVLSNLYGNTISREAAIKAESLGYLVGPYDSYHSIHSPDAGSDDTWETAQFDLKAFEGGRVINFDGSGHRGFKGNGYHFSPEAAWPYVQERVDGIVKLAPYNTWFIDCDATAECFDDYHPDHPTNRLQDAQLRRHRLTWLEEDRGMVVGSEGGSILFSDVIHYGHGVHTPFIGHLDPAFRDRESPHFLGGHWPPDTPDVMFGSTPVPPSMMMPYFDPTIRFPLYQAVIGDEVIATHHWSFDSLKFEDIAQTRELMEILYRVPPMYHLNRGSWPDRKDRILNHFAFWSPLHRAVATAPLARFDYLSEDRQVQRETYETAEGEVSITVNFGTDDHPECPARSAKVSGAIGISGKVYRP